MTATSPSVTRLASGRNARTIQSPRPSFRPVGLKGHQYVLRSCRYDRFRRFTIAFGDGADERDEISGSLWRGLVLLLAHEALHGRERPGVRLRRRTRPLSDRGLGARLGPRFGMEVAPAADTEPFALAPEVARQLADSWGLVAVVDVPDESGDYVSFFAPTPLARLALEHTRELREAVRAAVEDVQQERVRKNARKGTP